MRSRRLYAAAALALPLALAACNSSASGGSTGGATGAAGGSGTGTGHALNIAVIPKAVGFDYWTHVESGAKCAAQKLGNVNVEWNGVAAETDVTGQVNLLDGYITRGVDSLIYAATDAKALVQVTNSAEQAKIPVYNIDSGTTPQNVPLFATDNVKGATQVADLMNTLLHGRATLRCSSSSPVR